MFPRHYFAGSYFAPSYWPQSQGVAAGPCGRRRHAYAAVPSRAACASN